MYAFVGRDGVGTHYYSYMHEHIVQDIGKVM